MDRWLDEWLNGFLTISMFANEKWPLIGPKRCFETKTLFPFIRTERALKTMMLTHQPHHPSRINKQLNKQKFDPNECDNTEDKHGF